MGMFFKFIKDNKREFLAFLGIIFVATFFWTQSRYPQLNEKEAMGQRIELAEALSFDAIVKIEKNDSKPKKIFLTTINWANTNKKGMGFGLLFAAIFLTFLRLIQNRLVNSDNDFLNAFIGMIIGAPLGVCVNCAAPIGKGMLSSGQKAVTALSTMHSSPTFNIVVLSMMFSLFPMHFSIIKIGFTAFFILIIMPLIVSLVFKRSPFPKKDKKLKIKIPLPANPTMTWKDSVTDVFSQFGKNFWFIIKTTLPTMVLAGLIGSIAVELFPLQNLGQLEFGLLTVLMVGLIGTLLPVPIAFDVVSASILMNSGLPVGLTMALFFCLGIYSVYPFLIVWKDISLKMATGIFIGVILTGASAGLVITKWNEYNFNKSERIFSETQLSLSKNALIKVSQIIKNECQVFKSQGLTSECNNSFILEQAVSKWGSDLCLKLEKLSDKKECLKRHEIETVGIKQFIVDCKNKKGKELKNECYDELFSKYLTLKSLKLKNTCGLFSNPIHHDGCLDLFLNVYMVQNPSLKVCDNYLREHNKDACIDRMMLNQIIKFKDHTNVCSKLGFKYKNKVRCLSIAKKVIKFNNISLINCNALENSSSVKVCKNQKIKEIVDIDTSNGVFCRMLESKEENRSCFTEFFLKKRKSDVKTENCGIKKNKDDQGKCYENLAKVREIQKQVISKSSFIGPISFCSELSSYDQFTCLNKTKKVYSSLNEYFINDVDFNFSLTDPVKEKKSFIKSSFTKKNYNKKLKYIKGNINILEMELNSRPVGKQSEKLFKKIDVEKLGIKSSLRILLLGSFAPFSQSNSVSSGDYNNDDLDDLIIPAKDGFFVYENLGGLKFNTRYITNNKLKGRYVILVAFVDINNDGWADIFTTTWGGENFFLINNQGRFDENDIISMPKNGNGTAMAAAFYDVNKNGLLDFTLGNWTNGSSHDSHLSSRNEYFENDNLNFNRNPLLGGSLGESLSVYFSDFNNDNYVDLFIANDFDPSDEVYLGGEKGFETIKDNGVLPITSTHNMSIDMADINNDLEMEIFTVDLDMAEILETKKIKYCDLIHDGSDKILCEKRTKIDQILAKGNITDCQKIKDVTERTYCISLFFIDLSINTKAENGCKKIPLALRTIKEFCEFNLANSSMNNHGRTSPKEVVPQTASNILLMKDEKNNYSNVAEEYQISDSGWSWNSRFADLDNDGWQDLYIANGFNEKDEVTTNVFFRNEKGRAFSRKEKEFGLDDYTHTTSYTYFDIDNDGDLDIASTGFNTPLKIFINNESKNNSIQFAINDNQGNYFGIGTKIIIYYGENKNQIREVKLGGGYQSFDTHIIHFGLGENVAVHSVKVIWSTGEISTFNNEFRANKRYIIVREKEEKLAKN